MQTPLLNVANLTYRRQNKAIINHCDLNLAGNEIVALIGPNGAGKTTLLQLIAGLKTPNSGKIERRASIKDQSTNTQWLGYLPDTAPLYPSMRVAEFLRFCAHIRGLASIHDAVNGVVADCGLEAVLNQRCGDLSHGYRQRVGLAQAIIHRPAVLLLDEPTNGLDYGQKKSLRPLMSSLGKRASVLMISHDYEEVIATAARIYLLDNGKVHELSLPAKEGLWWLTLADNATYTLPFISVIDEGRYIALDAARYGLSDIYQTLSQANICAHVSATYPVEALQMRVEHVG